MTTATKRRWSFSLRMLFIVVMACSVLLYLLFSSPDTVATPGLLLIAWLLTSFFLAGAFYGGDNLKAFCRGALVPGIGCHLFIWWFTLQFFNVDFTDGDTLAEIAESAASPLRQWVAGYAVLGTLIGMATLAFKRLIEPKTPLE